MNITPRLLNHRWVRGTEKGRLGFLISHIAINAKIITNAGSRIQMSAIIEISVYEGLEEVLG